MSSDPGSPLPAFCADALTELDAAIDAHTRSHEERHQLRPHFTSTVDHITNGRLLCTHSSLNAIRSGIEVIATVIRDNSIADALAPISNAVEASLTAIGSELVDHDPATLSWLESPSVYPSLLTSDCTVSPPAGESVSSLDDPTIVVGFVHVVDSDQHFHLYDLDTGYLLETVRRDEFEADYTITGDRSAADLCADARVPLVESQLLTPAAGHN